MIATPLKQKHGLLRRFASRNDEIYSETEARIIHSASLRGGLYPHETIRGRRMHKYPYGEERRSRVSNHEGDN